MAQDFVRMKKAKRKNTEIRNINPTPTLNDSTRTTIRPIRNNLDHNNSTNNPTRTNESRVYNSHRVYNPSRKVMNGYRINSIHNQERVQLENFRNGISQQLTRPAIHASDLEDIYQSSPPPLDEYIDFKEEVPPYRENLHKYLDLFSFDPRFAPVLRVNKALIPNNEILEMFIKYFKKFNLLPSEVNLWEIHHIDDLEFNARLPEIIPQPITPIDSRSVVEDLERIERFEENQNNNNNTYLGNDELDLEYAYLLSLVETTSQTRRNYEGFRFNPLTTITG